MAEVVILERFFHQIHLHLVSCYGNAPRWPVILGVFGRSGDGKSVQLSASLERCNVEILRINAADLESGLAGEPGKHIARMYAAASMAIDKDVPTAIVVDDVDTTVGEWEQNTGTVNHQQVLAELMHLADQPVDRSRNFPRRVPIFMTGNNLARLYPPMRRHGRMNTFSWRPEPSETALVVACVFEGIAEAEALGKLVADFGDEPLAFFAQVHQRLTQENVATRLQHLGHDMQNFLRRRDHLRHLADTPRQITGSELLDIAQRIQGERLAALHDFLQEPGPSGVPK